MTEYVTSAELDAILEMPDDELLMPRVYLEQIRNTLRASEETVARRSARLNEKHGTEFVTFPVVRR